MVQRAQVKGGVLRPNAATLAKFQKSWMTLIDQMTRETTAELTALFKVHEDNPVFDSLEVRQMRELGLCALVMPAPAMDASIADQAQAVINQLLAKFTVLFAHQASGITDTMVANTVQDSQSSLKRSLKDISKDLTIQPTEQLKQTIDAAAQESAGLIRRVPADYLPQVQGDVMRSITTGNGLADLEPALKERNVKVKNWAANVSKDQTRKVYNNINKVRMQDAGAKEYEWIHSGGSNKPRKYHMDQAPAGLNGGIFKFDDPPIIDERTGERGIPGQLPYCLPATSMVEIPAGVNKLYRRLYAGELVTLVADNGATLEATPNHPVLTQRGWIAAESVDVGDYVIHSPSNGKITSEANVNNTIASIGELFDAASLFIGPRLTHTSGTKLQFHGDGTNNEVDVIDIDGLLPLEWDAALCEKFCEEVFTWANINGRIAQRLPGAGALALCLLGVSGSAPSLVGSVNNLLALIGSPASEVQNARRACIAYVDARFQQAATNDGPRHLELLRQLFFGNTGQVEPNNFNIGHVLAAIARARVDAWGKVPAAEELAKSVGVYFQDGCNVFDVVGSIKKFHRVIEKRICEFAGHVYNVESKAGWLIANNIVNHNCGCTMRPIFRFDDEDD